MTRPNFPARDERRLTRAPVLICSLAVALCSGGAAVAAAQTPPDPGADEPTTTSPETTTVPEPTDETATAGAEAAEPGAPGSGDEGKGDRKRAGGPRLVLENANPRKVIVGRRNAAFNFETARGTAALKVKAVKSGSGKIVKSWDMGTVQSGNKESVSWAAKKANGRYFFRVQTANGDSLDRRHAKGKRNVRVSDGMFPVRGRHQYWDGFGAGRGHDGQDVGAKCGTEMVAAQAGKVVYRGNDSGGYGNYLVINVAGRSAAHVYAHLKRKARVGKGDNVATGERIGAVGATGNASGCHLHFEYWKGKWPGGHPSSVVTKRLKAWDKAS